jgi:protoporphyrinogen oxidase
MSDRQILIVGAGISGLTIGYELARRGCKVVIVEKANEVGGLAKSFQYNGFTFDIGPHRFYTVNPSILRFIKHILGDEMVSIFRHTAVQVFGRYHTWPLRPVVLFGLPLGIMVKSGIDLFFTRLKKGGNENNFKDYICNRYGATIYEVFFKKYTEKFLGLQVDKVHSDWARASIDKAIIDKCIILRDLFDILKSTIMPVAIRTVFLYPKRGMGFFCNRLAEGIRQRGGIIHTGNPVTDIGYSEDRIDSVNCNGRIFKPYRLVWTAPITLLYKLLGLRLNLNYLSLILYNVELHKPLKYTYQWCYYPDQEIIFNRVSAPLLFSKDLVPDGRASLSVELTCTENDERWNRAEALIGQIKNDLVKVNLINKVEDVASVYVEHIPDAYPIYKLDYQQQIHKVRENLKKFKNLTLAGRSGLFWFNNMDESIENGLTVAEDILRQ